MSDYFRDDGAKDIARECYGEAAEIAASHYLPTLLEGATSRYESL